MWTSQTSYTMFALVHLR